MRPRAPEGLRSVWIATALLASCSAIHRGNELSIAQVVGALKRVGATQVFVTESQSGQQLVFVTGGRQAVESLIVRVFSSESSAARFVLHWKPPTDPLHALPGKKSYLPQIRACNVAVGSTLLPYLVSRDPTRSQQQDLMRAIAAIKVAQQRTLAAMRRLC
jgi:hypothetical protein